MTILEKIKAGSVIFDGGMGTMIQPHMQLGELPEILNLTKPEVITAVHKAYLDAGADVVETNSLNANGPKLKRAGKGVDEVISAAVKNAKTAVEQAGHGYVALSMGPTGIMLEPLGDLSFDDAVDIYSEMAAAGEKAGADMVIIETVSDLHEIKAAIYGAKQATKLPVAVTMTFEMSGRTLTGADILTSVVTLEALGADIIGMNCGLGPDQMCDLVPRLTAAATVPVLINPNAGLPKRIDGQSVYTVGPEEFANDAIKLAHAGARLLGGCCGTTPAHIARLKALLADIEPVNACEGAPAAITSGSKCLMLDGSAEIARLTDDDVDDLTDSAMDAEAGGVRIEYSPLAEAVTTLQEMYLKPMYLVSEDMDELREAVRAYNGKPLIGIANAENIDEYIEIARLGAAIAVDSAATAEKAAAILGKHNVFIDDGETLTDISGETVADIVEE